VLGKDDADHIVHFVKILKITIGDAKKDKRQKIKSFAEKIPSHHRKLFSPTKYIKFDDTLLDILTAD
jgi:hypothetical protein